MKPTATLAILSAVFLTDCNRTSKTAASPSTVAADAAAKDIPLLPIKKGDTWNYDVHLEIPAGISSPEAPAVDLKHPLTRVYLGKVVPGKDLPESDCFEVTVPSSPVEREFVEIHDDRILMRGSLRMRDQNSRPVWLTKPIPFVIAGMKPGTSSPEISLADGAASRKTEVIAREDVTVPVGKFSSLRLLMSGMDGSLEMRRTIWFAPGTGIVREEKTRYNAGKLIFRETQELVATSVAKR